MGILKHFQDNNMGLVNQALSSLYKHNILRLTQTYLTLSLHDIANSVQLGSSKEAEMHVLRMVFSFHFSLSALVCMVFLFFIYSLFALRFKMVKFLPPSIRRMEWSVSMRILSNTKLVR